MLKPIKENKEKIWNERFEQRLLAMNLSQRKFIALYKERFGTGSQSDVSKWKHVGDIDGKTNKKRGFPAFETMRNIAEILEVDVGYLIGETDFETYEVERTSKFTGLSSESVRAIRNLTTGKSIPPFHKYPDEQCTAAFELIINSEFLVEFLKGICVLAESIDKVQNPTDFFDKALKKIPEELRDDAYALWGDAEEAINRGLKPTPELWAYVNILDDGAGEDMWQPDGIARDIRAAKYSLQEIYIKMLEEVVSANNISSLLPHYATKEELKELLKNQRFKAEKTDE